jgi:hypothetical protein
MIRRILSPRGIGMVAAAFSALAGLLAAAGVPLGVHLLAKHSPLGETGRTFFTGVFIGSTLLSLYCGMVAALLIDARGISTSISRRFPTWHRLAASIGVVFVLCYAEWAINFFRQFLILLGPGPEFYNRAQWLGIPLLISNETYSLPDYFTTMFLLLAASSAGGTYLRISRGTLRARLPREAFALFAAGFCFLAFDEYVTFHEFVGANLPVLRDVKFVGHPDDLVMLSYFAIADLTLYRYLPDLLRDRVGLAIAATAALLQGVAAFGDAWFPPSLGEVEELLEVMAAASYFVFVVRYGEPAPNARELVHQVPESQARAVSGTA